jgi:hypothetical protein
MAPLNKTKFEVGDLVNCFGVPAYVTGYAQATGRFEVTFGDDPFAEGADFAWVGPEDMALVQHGALVPDPDFQV